jgi:hypothetical protein
MIKIIQKKMMHSEKNDEYYIEKQKACPTLGLKPTYPSVI